MGNNLYRDAEEYKGILGDAVRDFKTYAKNTGAIAALFDTASEAIMNPKLKESGKVLLQRAKAADTLASELKKLISLVPRVDREHEAWLKTLDTSKPDSRLLREVENLPTINNLMRELSQLTSLWEQVEPALVPPTLLLMDSGVAQETGLYKKVERLSFEYEGDEVWGSIQYGYTNYLTNVGLIREHALDLQR